MRKFLRKIFMKSIENTRKLLENQTGKTGVFKNTPERYEKNPWKTKTNFNY